MSTTFTFSTDASWEEADTLISILRTWGVEYLVGEDHPINPTDIATDRQSTVKLIQRLARCAYPRIRDASISLFLLHPELVDAILEAIQISETEIAEQIITSTLAALCLQRLWSVRLAMALGHIPDFPGQPFAHLWHSRHLPPPKCHDGELGLVTLQKFE